MSERVRNLDVSLIRPSKRNPRKDFDADALTELAASIKELGVLQPIVVVPAGKSYRIVAGERRWRATKQAGIRTIPAVVRELSRKDIAKVALVENLQRRDLNPVEEAEAIEE